MKNFLVKATAGLFVLSLLVAPVVVFAMKHTITPSEKCTLRSDVSADELESLTGKSQLTALSSGTKIEGTSVPEEVGDNFGLICAFSFVEWISNIIFLVIGGVAVLVIAGSAIFFLTAAGNEGRLGKAKAYLLYGTLGIAVAALAKLIPAFVSNVLGA